MQRNMKFYESRISWFKWTWVKN